MRGGLPGYDAWLTRKPWEYRQEPPVPRCGVCGVFVKDDPIHHLSIEEVSYCDGRPIDMGDDSWTTTVCNEDWGTPDEIAHEAHFFPEGGYVVTYRRCSRGHISKEFEI